MRGKLAEMDRHSMNVFFLDRDLFRRVEMTK